VLETELNAALIEINYLFSAIHFKIDSQNYCMRLLFLLSSILTFNSVFSQDTIEQFNTRLMGRWDWIKTEIMDRGGGDVRDSSSCHCTKYLVFKPNNIIEYFENNVLQNSSTYSLVNWVFMKDPVKVIIHGEKINGQIVLNGNTFGVGAFGGCGAIEYYKKRE
jgi:hypothetical protein